MINKRSIELVDASHFSKSFRKPLYDSYCFSRVPGTIRALLGLEEGLLPALPAEAVGGSYGSHDLVILLFVDGFGWQFFEKYADKYPFLKRFKKEGVVSKITSQFPSTTAAHVTTMNTGLPVGQSGVYEWFYYEPKLDCVISPLLFSFAGDGRIETLKKTGISPKEIYPTHTFYEQLHKEGVRSFAMQHYTISQSVYSQVMLKGAKALPYGKIGQALENLVEICSEVKDEPHYVFLYFSDIDSMGHRYGVGSEAFEKAMDEFWSEMEKSFWQKLENSDRKIACAVISDHGMVSVDPKKTTYLNLEMPIEKHIQRNRKGELIAPAGSCRDFFLHIKEEDLLEMQETLRKFLDGRAEVYLTDSLIQEGIFGQLPLSKEFLGRVGNLVILPYKGEAVWWYEKNHFEQHFFGAHGGLTKEEMEIPFLFIEK
ncbi:MAG: alkaline phosphatase family protein [Chlamydiales bacterium]|nr:alkaline phosphatase family protein [Chlamydiales bacterium]